MNELEKKLLRKGWKEKEIKKTIGIIDKYKNLDFIRRVDKKIYWFSLIMAVLTTLISSVVLVPFLLTISEPTVYIFVVVIALTFGYVFQWLIGEIEIVQLPKHLLILMVIPIFSVFIFFFMVGYANYLQDLLKFENAQNNILIGVIYSVSFLIPYFIREAIKVKRR